LAAGEQHAGECRCEDVGLHLVATAGSVLAWRSEPAVIMG